MTRPLTIHDLVRAHHAANGGGENPLLRHPDAAALLRDMAPDNWSEYAAQWPALVAGCRPLRITPGTNGRLGWIRSYVHYHIDVELLAGESVRLPLPPKAVA